MNHFQQQVTGLDELISARLCGATVQVQPIPGAIPVLQVTIEGREELPIFVTRAEPQVLCIVYLWDDSEVRDDQRVALLETLLDLNVSIPLSSFGRIAGRYVMYGALARDASAQDIAQDVAALSDNSLDALQALNEFLK